MGCKNQMLFVEIMKEIRTFMEIMEEEKSENSNLLP
jgi:hypothetical protein